MKELLKKGPDFHRKCNMLSETEISYYKINWNYNLCKVQRETLKLRYYKTCVGRFPESRSNFHQMGTKSKTQFLI